MSVSVSCFFVKGEGRDVVPRKSDVERELKEHKLLGGL